MNNRWTPILVVLGFMLVLGMFEATTLYVDTIRSGRTASVLRILQGTLPSWLMVLALLPPIRWL